MKRIDSPTDVALTQFEGEPEDTTQEIILKIAGALCLPIGLAAALREHFSSKCRYERIQQVFLAFKSDIDSLQRESAKDKIKAEAIEDRLKSSKFTEAVLTAAEEASRTAESKKLERLASTLANGVDPTIIQTEDDLPSFVRDVSQLSEQDIEILSDMKSTPPIQLSFDEAARSAKSTEESPGIVFRDFKSRERIEDDDFYSTAYRLVGFGLAVELPSPDGSRSPKKQNFILTRRGQKLISLLRKRSRSSSAA